MVILCACFWPIIPPWYASHHQYLVDLPRWAAFVLGAHYG
jgi:hypothetical protein